MIDPFVDLVGRVLKTTAESDKCLRIEVFYATTRQGTQINLPKMIAWEETETGGTRFFEVNYNPQTGEFVGTSYVTKDKHEVYISFQEWSERKELSLKNSEEEVEAAYQRVVESARRLKTPQD